MKNVQFGQTQLRVSRLCFGTWNMSGDWGRVDGQDSRAAIRSAVDAGINFFDTAQAYGWGAAERLLHDAIGEHIRTRRSELVIATKGGLRKEGQAVIRDSSPSWLRSGLTDSLRALGTDYVDIYMIHWPDSKTPPDEAAATLDDFVKEGKVRYVGVSNFDATQMAGFERTRKIDALQPPYHLFRRGIESEILPYCSTHGIGVFVYGPRAHGLLTGKITINTKFSADDWRSRSRAFRDDVLRTNLGIVHKLQAYADSRGWSIDQLALAWTLANPAVDAAIIGARNALQVQAAMPAVDVSLRAADLLEIDALTAGAIPIESASPEGIW